MTAQTNTVTATIGKKNFETRLTAGRHSLLADEPESIGGQDTGPAATDLLRLSLASCTAITLRMYANRKEYEIDEIRVHVTSEKVANTFTVDMKIEIDGQLDDAIRSRMLQIAKACPVHKILTNPVEIKTELR